MHIHAHPNHPNKLFLFKHCCIYSTIFSNGHFRYLNWRYCTMYSHILEVYVTEDKMSEFLLWCNFLTVKICQCVRVHVLHQWRGTCTHAYSGLEQTWTVIAVLKMSRWNPAANGAAQNQCLPENGWFTKNRNLPKDAEK